MYTSAHFWDEKSTESEFLSNRVSTIFGVYLHNKLSFDELVVKGAGDAGGESIPCVSI